MNLVSKQADTVRMLTHIRLKGIQNSKKWLGFIIMLGLLLRIFVTFFTSLPHMHRDSYDYFKQAETILEGGYTNFFPNGYPFLIALAKIVAGAKAQLLLLWLNILMSTLTIYFIFDMGLRIFKNIYIALLAAFLLSVFPTQVNYARWLTTEVPTVFLLTAAYFCLYRNLNLLSGILFGLATVVRTDELPIFLLLFALGFIYSRKWNWRLVTGALIPIMIVGSYCLLKTGKFSLAGHGKVNLMLSITASGGYVDWTYNDKHPEVVTSKQALNLYFDHLRSDPAAFLKQKISNLWELWGFFPSSSGGNRSVISRLGIGLGNAFLVFFGLYGWRKNRYNFYALILILPFLLLTVLHTFLLALPRYTYPVEPFMILLGSWTLHTWIGGKPILKKISSLNGN
jgi:hypothetical protein